VKTILLLLLLFFVGCGEPAKPYAEAYVDYTNYHDKQYMPDREKARAGINITEAIGKLFDFEISEAEFRINNQASVLPDGMERVRELHGSLSKATDLLTDTKDHKIKLENHKAKLDSLRRSLEISAKKEGREKDVPADDYTGYEKQLDDEIAASKVKLAKLKERFNEKVTAAGITGEVGLVK